MGLVRRILGKIKYATAFLYLTFKFVAKYGLFVVAIVAGLLVAINAGIYIGQMDEVSEFTGGQEDADTRYTGEQRSGGEVTPRGETQNSETPRVDADTETPEKSIGGSTYNAAEMEDALAERINDYRSSKGIDGLDQVDQLRMNARGYSKDMAKRNFYSHTDPEGRGIRSRLLSLPMCDAGSENINQILIGKEFRNPDTGITHYIDTQQEAIDYAMESWAQSPGHRRNMLSRNRETSGVGVYIEESSGKVYATHHLCSAS